MHLLGKMRVVMLHGFDAVTHNLRDELALLAIDDQIVAKECRLSYKRMSGRY